MLLGWLLSGLNLTFPTNDVPSFSLIDVVEMSELWVTLLKSLVVLLVLLVLL